MSDKINVRIQLVDQSSSSRPRLLRVLKMHKPVHGEYIVCGGSRFKVGQVFHLVDQPDADIAVDCSVEQQVYEKYLLDASWTQKQ